VTAAATAAAALTAAAEDEQGGCAVYSLTIYCSPIHMYTGASYTACFEQSCHSNTVVLPCLWQTLHRRNNSVVLGFRVLQLTPPSLQGPTCHAAEVVAAEAEQDKCAIYAPMSVRMCNTSNQQWAS
jgi:hypothetical protein